MSEQARGQQGELHHVWRRKAEAASVSSSTIHKGTNRRSRERHATVCEREKRSPHTGTEASRQGRQIAKAGKSDGGHSSIPHKRLCSRDHQRHGAGQGQLSSTPMKRHAADTVQEGVGHCRRGPRWPVHLQRPQHRTHHFLRQTCGTGYGRHIGQQLGSDLHDGLPGRQRRRVQRSQALECGARRQPGARESADTARAPGGGTCGTPAHAAQPPTQPTGRRCTHGGWRGGPGRWRRAQRWRPRTGGSPGSRARWAVHAAGCSTGSPCREKARGDGGRAWRQ